MGFIDDLADLFGEVLVTQAGTLNHVGDFTPVGASVSYDCHIEGETKLVRDREGKEVASSLQVFIKGAPGLTVDGHRYTLPAGFSPRLNIEAIGIEYGRDEDGAVYEVVLFP